MAVSMRTTKLSEAPAAIEDFSLLVMVKPVGTVNLDVVKVALPVFLTVKVRLMPVPF